MNWYISLYGTIDAGYEYRKGSRGAGNGWPYKYFYYPFQEWTGYLNSLENKSAALPAICSGISE
jgi:hypothetical protein